MQILETERLSLRHLVPDDLDALSRLYRDPEIRRYFPDGTRTREEARDELEWFAHGHPQHPELGLWATVLKENGALIGRCGLLPWTIEGHFEIEVAYLIDKAHWGRGLGTEAALAVSRHAFERLGVQRLVCLIHPDNTASQRVASHIGMAHEKDIDDDVGHACVYAMAVP